MLSRPLDVGGKNAIVVTIAFENQDALIVKTLVDSVLPSYTVVLQQLLSHVDPGAKETSFMKDEKNRILSKVREHRPLMIKKLLELSHRRISKDADKSVALRVQANEIYNKKVHSSQEHLQIWKLYSKCVAFAPPLSKELSSALYNRSSLLFHLGKYTECMKDLTHAEKCDCSDLLKMKISYRRAECLTKMRNVSKADVEAAVTQIQNLSLDDKLKNDTIIKLKRMSSTKVTSKYIVEEDNASQALDIDFQKGIPCASTALALKYSEEFGRHVVATRDIKPGEIVIVEKMLPLLNQSALYTHCSNCSKVAWASIPCDTCGFAMYCSSNCKNDAWNRYHDIECNIISLLDFETDSDEIESQSVRLVIRAFKECNGSISALKEKLTKIDNSTDNRTRGFAANNTFGSETCESYLGLLTNADQRPTLAQEEISKHAAKLVYYLALFTEMFGKKLDANDDILEFEQDDVLFIGSLISRMYHMIITNQFGLAELRNVRSRKEAPMIQNQEGLGTAVAPFTSYLNHACLLNVASCMTDDGCMIIFAVLPIKKGSQIFKKYMNRIACDECPKDKRRYVMKEKYGISDCKCIACIENLPTVYEAPEIHRITKDREILNLVDAIYLQNARLTVGVEKVTKMMFDCLEMMVKKSLYRCQDFYRIIDLVIIFFYLMHDRWFQIPDDCRK
ncbi:hypothetical protein QAD02_008730 [Eretmocerus hayati]|uniref:Uncharacterized protein n=1 Tax=Eretmocerus hayati TaxID=131215 RepID=A0ACC2N8J6_9HYME|nr:hypothetical protein QAD02_008730 [Eretmocerus hayati]